VALLVAVVAVEGFDGAGLEAARSAAAALAVVAVVALEVAAVNRGDAVVVVVEVAAVGLVVGNEAIAGRNQSRKADWTHSQSLSSPYLLLL
jgi:hypothetical protein